MQVAQPLQYPRPMQYVQPVYTTAQQVGQVGQQVAQQVGQAAQQAMQPVIQQGSAFLAQNANQLIDKGIGAAMTALSATPVGAALKGIKYAMLGALVLNLIIFIILTFLTGSAVWFPLKIFTFIMVLANAAALIAVKSSFSAIYL